MRERIHAHRRTCVRLWSAVLGAALTLTGPSVGRADGVAGATPFAAALTLYRARHYSAARPIFQALAAQRPEDAELDFYLGRIALWFDDEAEALRRLEAARRLAPDDARIENALGDAYGLSAQDASLLMKPAWACRCRSAYERAIRLDPTQPRYHWSLLGFALMAPCLVGGGPEKAREQAAEIARLDPAMGRVAGATIDLATDHPAEAFARFDAVLRVAPDDRLALYQVGRCAAFSGQQLERGLVALRRCLALAGPGDDDQPTPANIHYRLGNILEKLGESAAAATEYRLAQTLEPDFRPAKVMLRF